MLVQYAGQQYFDSRFAHILASVSGGDRSFIIGAGFEDSVNSQVAGYALGHCWLRWQHQLQGQISVASQRSKVASSGPEIFAFRLIYPNCLYAPKPAEKGGRRNVDCTLINRKKDFILENITGSIAAYKLHGGSSLLEFVLTRLFRDISPVSLSICNLL